MCQYSCFLTFKLLLAKNVKIMKNGLYKVLNICCVILRYCVLIQTFLFIFSSGRLGENMSVKRAVTVGVPAEWHIGSYVHGGVGTQAELAMGRYGALVIFEGGKEGEEDVLGRKLGRHVVGEAPQSLGNMDDLPCGESETRLLPQTFLGDPSRTVAQFLKGQQARVFDFIRFQCGETLNEEK